MTIKSFEGQYKCFSNFYPRHVTYNCATYHTKEHAFQSHKATNETDFMFIFNSDSPYQAKKRSRTIKIRNDWDKIKVKIMHEIVLSFFTQWKDCKEILLSTRNEEIQEGNNHGDRFWGMVNGEGENWLGKILMDVRIILQGFPSVMLKDDINQM